MSVISEIDYKVLQNCEECKQRKNDYTRKLEIDKLVRHKNGFAYLTYKGELAMKSFKVFKGEMSAEDYINSL
jgi:hypothetical protein